MAVSDGTIYEFADFRLIPEDNLLLRDGESISLPPKAFSTLVLLLENHGHLVRKDELIEKIWADAFVEEAAVSRCVWTIRSALGEDSKSQRFIQTVPKRGYRFVAEVTRVGPNGAENGTAAQHASEAGVLEQVQRIQPTVTKSGAHAVVSLAEWQGLVDHLDAEQEPSRRGNGRVVDGVTEAANQPETVDLAKEGPASLTIWKGYAVIAVAVFAISTTILYLTSTGRPALGAGKGNRIAVLPLKPVNSANRDEVYEIGIADSLIYRLGTMKGIIVRPLGATRKYDDVAQDPLAAGKEQQADYVLAANYQIADGKIRITAQLFNVESGKIEETYKTEKDASNVFALQDTIAGEIGNLLQTRFALTANPTTARRGTNNEEAYRLYLQGKNLTMRIHPDARKKAIECFEQAIMLDPKYALAYARMAFASYSFNENSSANAEKVREIVNKALELDPNLAEAYVVRGLVSGLHDWDYRAAEKDYLRAIELEPNSDTAHWLYAMNLSNRGRFDEALAEIETAQAIDPGATMYIYHRGQVLYCARRYDEAVTQFQQARDLDDRLVQPYAWLSRIYEIRGDYATAYQFFLKKEERSPRKDRLEIYQKDYGTGGWLGVRRELAESLGIQHFDLARLYALQGEKDAAFESLNKAVEKRDWQIVTLKVEPALDSLRVDPRFDELLGRVGWK